MGGAGAGNERQHYGGFRSVVELDDDPINALPDHGLDIAVAHDFSGNRFSPVGSKPDGMLFGITL
jgi:hypothetical protein